MSIDGFCYAISCSLNYAWVHCILCLLDISQALYGHSFPLFTGYLEQQQSLPSIRTVESLKLTNQFPTIPVSVHKMDQAVIVECVLFVCDDSGACLVKYKQFEIPLTFEQGSEVDLCSIIVKVNK